MCHSCAAVGEPQTNERRHRAHADDVAPRSEINKKAAEVARTSPAGPGLAAGPGFIAGPAPRTRNEGEASLAREGLGEAAAASRPKAQEKLRFSEEDLRTYIASLHQTASGLLASVRCSPSARLEPATDVAELFWKLVERRLYGAVFSYEKAGQRWVDEIAGVPGGFSLTRSVR